MAVGKAQVGEWLKSMGLDRFVQAFLDNGYDDMQVCRQIGHPDLDAIGVEEQDARENILANVQELLERDSLDTGPTPVYYTLENPEYDDPPGPDDVSPTEQTPPSLPARGSRRQNIKSVYPPTPPLHRVTWVSRASGGGSEPTADRKNEQERTSVRPDHSSLPAPERPCCDDQVSLDSAPSDQSGRSRNTSGTSSSEGGRRLPGTAYEQSFAMSASQGSSDSLNRHASDADRPEDRAGKKGSTLGRLFRKHGSPKPSKYKHKPYQGDPSARDITMTDDERILIMLQVKEGTITQEQALEKVKLHGQHSTLRTLGVSAVSTPDITQCSTLSASKVKSPDKSQKSTPKLKIFTKLLNKRSHKQQPPIQSQHSLPEPVKSTPEPVRKTSLPISAVPSPDEHDYHTPHTSRHMAPTQTSSGELDDWQDEQLHKKTSYQGQESELDSTGMSERTASSSLDSVQSYSGVPSHSSSSSLDDGNQLARAIVDCTPNVFDKEALYLKKGDIIQVLNRHESGNWLGRLNNRVGYFKFINVELISEESLIPTVKLSTLPRQCHSARSSPASTHRESCTVQELLVNLQLTHLTSVFCLNYYQTLDDFMGLTEEDLASLDIIHPDDQARIMHAVHNLQAGKGYSDLDVNERQRDSTVTLCPDSPGSQTSDHSRRSRALFQPSPMIRPAIHMGSHSRQRKTLMPVSRKMDSGFESIATDSVISVESSISRDSSNDSSARYGREVQIHTKSDYFDERREMEMYDRTLKGSLHGDTDNCVSVEQKFNTLTCTSTGRQASRDKHKAEQSKKHSVHGSSSKIPQIRSRTHSLDQSMSRETQSRSPKNVPKSRCRVLASGIETVYSSAPNTPVLQRDNKQSSKRCSHGSLRRPRDSPVQGRESVVDSGEFPTPGNSVCHYPDLGLITGYPHLLAGVKTAHVRSLGMTSRSTPSSPAAIPKISPAARSSVHAIPRSPRQAARHRQKAVEARVEPISFGQGENTSSFSKGVHGIGVAENISIATILMATGLGVYEPEFKSRGIISRQHFLTLKEKDFRNLGIYNKDHIQTLMTWQQQLEFENEPRDDKKARAKSAVDSGFRDKV